MSEETRPGLSAPATDPEDALEGAVLAALEAGDPDRVGVLAAPLHYADLADLVERIGGQARKDLVRILGGKLTPEVLSELDETVRDEVIAQIGVKGVAAAITEADVDDAVFILEDLDESEQRKVLGAIPAAERTLIEQSLAYPEDSAGRLMQREVVTVPTFWTVGETIDFMRRSADEGADTLPEVFYEIYIVDPSHRPVGTIPLSRLLRSRRPTAVTAIMETAMNLIRATTDQEEVAFLFQQRDLVSAPVVDRGGRLVGAITIDDVVDVIHEENEEDFMRLGGVVEGDLHAAPVATARRRFRWLFVTLINNIIAATVISRFETTIEEIVALAVLMPIVAAMGGNAGMQAVTVVVRALATRELSGRNVVRVVSKEVAVGVMNGVVFALIMGVIAALWFKSPPLGLVLGSAMVFNMVWAGLAGTVIPFVLARFGIDPAIAAGPFLTTTTDVLGFACFLGLATLFLL